jgi:LppP/LprE lipoprotein
VSAGRRARVLVLAALSLSACATAPPAPPAGGGWLDQPLLSWNGGGVPIPRAPAPTAQMQGNRERCRAGIRPPRTAEDQAVAQAGWWLSGPAHVAGETSVVPAATEWDGMCRPWNFQVFVFIRDRYAGTLSPQRMNARTDGAWQAVRLESPRHLTAEFLRYTDADPLCCPSRLSEVDYRIDESTRGPVVVPVTVRTRALPR